MSHDLQFSIEGEGEGDMDMSFASPGVHSTANASTANASTTNASTANSQVSSSLSLQNSSHPVVCVFHCLFKLLAMLLYIFGGWFASDNHGEAHFITVTVICILLMAADFWVVKNITGRLLVGLRWWNQVDGDSTRWIFESADEKASNKFDQSFFWTVLYITPILWMCLFIVGLLKLQLGWLMTVFMGGSLSAANVYGYYKCSSDQKAKFTLMVQQGAQQGALAAMRSNLFGMLVGTMTTPTQPVSGGGTQTYV